MFLAIVCCQDTYLVCRITKQAHIHEECHNILCFTKILKFKRGGKKDKKKRVTQPVRLERITPVSLLCIQTKNSVLRETSLDLMFLCSLNKSHFEGIKEAQVGLITSFWLQRTAENIYINITVRHGLTLSNIYSEAPSFISTRLNSKYLIVLKYNNN